MLKNFAVRSFCSQIPFLLLTTLVAGCGSKSQVEIPDASIEAAARTSPSSSAREEVVEPVQLTALEATSDSPARPHINPFPKVVIRTSMGEIKIKLDQEKAPLTVENFLSNYVMRGFYSNTVFHYVDRGFMIAGGGYTPDLEPKEPRTWILNESNNGLSNRRATIAMARLPDYANSATSQFFINLVDNDQLDHQPSDEEDEANGYCVFGEVISGMDVVDRIAEVEVSDRDQFPKSPVTPVVIESIERIE